MTAEIAILNRNAVAMAADSAVTLQLPGGQKIYNTVNKLFALSKYRPVGVMVYGSGDFMRIPWETIIKMYRADLYEGKYDSLEEYASNFINFFERENILFPAQLQDESASDYLKIGFSRLRQTIDKEVEQIIKTIGSIDADQLKTLVKEKILTFVQDLEKCDNLPGIGPDDIEKCEKELQHAGALMLCKKYTRGNYSGIVIAGYGEKDFFPSLLSYECECVINSKLRYIETNRVKVGTADDAALASVIPFAQREMVNRFMEGVTISRCANGMTDANARD